MSYDEFGHDRELLRAETESLLSHLHGHPLYLYEDTSGSNRSHEPFGRTFTFTHTHFGGLLGYRLVGEYLDPYLTFTFHVTHDGLTGSFYLATGDPGAIESLDTERTESQLVASLSQTLHAAFLHSSELCLFWL